jgi:hypothetical protein
VVRVRQANTCPKPMCSFNEHTNNDITKDGSAFRA